MSDMKSICKGLLDDTGEAILVTAMVRDQGFDKSGYVGVYHSASKKFFAADLTLQAGVFTIKKSSETEKIKVKYRMGAYMSRGARYMEPAMLRSALLVLANNL